MYTEEFHMYDQLFRWTIDLYGTLLWRTWLRISDAVYFHQEILPILLFLENDLYTAKNSTIFTFVNVEFIMTVFFKYQIE